MTSHLTHIYLVIDFLAAPGSEWGMLGLSLEKKKLPEMRMDTECLAGGTNER